MQQGQEVRAGLEHGARAIEQRPGARACGGGNGGAERQRRLGTAGARASEAASWRVRGVSGRAAGRCRAQRIAARRVEAACVLQGCVAWRALVVCLPACWVRVRGSSMWVLHGWAQQEEEGLARRKLVGVIMD